MNLDKTKNMELTRNIAQSDENSLRPATPIIIVDSQNNCEIRQNLGNIIRKYSNLTRDLCVYIRILETDTAFILDDLVYTEHCERYFQYSNYRTEMEDKFKSFPS
ncbi:hypothetical protein NPIL_214271 [Nephila pilipes]|uniref:Uncharacterized protein n=1 Tax=Nephila pilipes TaxID=299642 RepID=A0A8X6NDL2_NEPPI|nr:hypothetical protein NPIL_214271 [Nephila pilipes]